MRRTAKKAKRLKRSPLDCASLWGWRSDDLALSVDWARLQTAFDQLTGPALWANKLSYRKVANTLTLHARGRKESLMSLLERSEPDSDASTQAASPHFVISPGIALQSSPGKGRGWFATRPLEAGTLVLLERPLVATLDVEWRDEPWADCASADSTALGLELAHCYSSSLALLLKHFHPEEHMQASSSDDEEDDPEAVAAMKDAIAVGWQQLDIPEAAKSRLQDVVRLNSLGFYTNSEQLCHHANFTALTGSGLFALASGFNHSCEPTVQRCSIGDLTAFVTSRRLQAGDELCISYIESELLCAPKSLRSQSLNRDFTCTCRPCTLNQPPELGASRNFMRMDAQVQARLTLLPPEERVEAVAAALSGQLDEGEEGEEEQPEKDHEVDEETKEGTGKTVVLLGKDAQELRVVQAVALMQLGRWEEALKVWRVLAAFSCHHCPPFDEAIAVYATQASLCAAEITGDCAKYARLAVEAHRVACGADIFKWRYCKEVEESKASQAAKESFWSAAKSSLPVRPFSEAVLDWKFSEDEVPNANQTFG
ncbi:unnamed protein product [Effrenium voratum]|uniref:SET domain-containing protein n=1 Tax=Effrenium voratum TaxID=2562239 RepID=A0AA36HZN0_9DINO|nr:unnamed protein product [Effrenium voratum]CAJ1422589.1 unnamed protein product [Effrenium voratum]